MIDHYVLGIDDDHIAQGEYSTYSEALDAADAHWVTYVVDGRLPWKIDIEARTEDGDTLSVETIYDDPDIYEV